MSQRQVLTSHLSHAADLVEFPPGNSVPAADSRGEEKPCRHRSQRMELRDVSDGQVVEKVGECA